MYFDRKILMNTQGFNIYGYCIKIMSTEFSLSELKVNDDFKLFSTTVEENPDVLIVIKKLTDLRLRGFRIGKTAMCEVRQLSLHCRQLVYRKHEKILALVNDSSVSKRRQDTIFHPCAHCRQAAMPAGM